MHVARPGRPRLPSAGLTLGATLMLAAFVAGCPRTPGKELQAGSYRAVLEVPGGGELPFGLDVALEERGPVLYLLNGEERVRVPEVEADEGRLRARMPGYETTLEATVAGGGLEGAVTLVHDGGRTLTLPFRARLGELWRFERKPLIDNADVAGRWQFEPGREGSPAAIAEFQQRFHEVTGTIVTPAGELGALAGDVRDERLRLSRFDGGAAVLVDAKLDRDGRLVGEVWTDRGGARAFSARRNPDADPDAVVRPTRLHDDAAPIAFESPDAQGGTVSSTDPAVQGRPMLVALTASWSPAAHEHAALLAEIDRRYRARGLAVIALMFEQHRESGRAAAAVRRFRAAYGLRFPTLVAGHAGPGGVEAVLPQVESFGAFPTTLFVDREGRVREVRSGFAGRVSGARHDQQALEYLQAVEALLATSSGPAPTQATPEDGSRLSPGSS